MVEFHPYKSLSLRPLKPLKFQPKVSDFCSLKSSKLPRIIRFRSLYLVELAFLPKSSTYSSLLQNFPSKSINTQHKNTQLCSAKTSISPNFASRGTHSVSIKLPKHPKFPPKLPQSRPRSPAHENFPSKPLNYWVRTTQFSPATLQVLTQIFKHGPFPDIVTYTTFIKFLGSYGCAADALELFDIMKKSHEPDVISFTVLIQILCDSKMVDQALDVFQEMAHYNCKPDIICYNILIDKLGEMGQEEKVWRLWSEMQSEGIHPDVVTYSSLVKSLCVMNKIVEALSVLESMEMSRMIHPNTYTYNTIIKAYLDRKRIKEALGILGRMVILGCKADLCSFNLLISYYSDLGEGMEAYEFLKKMTRSGVEASEGSYRICINGLMKQGKVDEVVELIEKIKLSIVTPSAPTWNRWITWLGKMGRLDEAYGVFLWLKDPDEITMNIVIHLLYKHKRGEEAWKVFKLMKRRKIEASAVTYNILIHGLGREGKLSKAFTLVSQMEAQVRNFPNVITYNCLLDCLCNRGEVDDACRLVLEMLRKGCQPDLISYNTLINGMISIGRMDSASKLFEHMRGGISSHLIPLEKLVEEMLTTK